MNMVEKFSTAPLPKLASPWVLGPIRRMPAARARSTIRTCFALCFGVGGLAESGSHHQGDLHAARGALVHARHRHVAGDGDDGDLRRIRQLGEAGIGFEALRLAAIRVDRIDLALVAELRQVEQRPPADLVGVLGGADDGDGGGLEGGPEGGTLDRTWAM